MAEVTSATKRAAATISAPAMSASAMPRLLTHGEQTRSVAAQLPEVVDELRERRELGASTVSGLALVHEADAVGLEAHDDGDVRRQGGAAPLRTGWSPAPGISGRGWP